MKMRLTRTIAVQAMQPAKYRSTTIQMIDMMIAPSTPRPMMITEPRYRSVK